jgi:hypothetical protein
MARSEMEQYRILWGSSHWIDLWGNMDNNYIKVDIYTLGHTIPAAQRKVMYYILYMDIFTPTNNYKIAIQSPRVRLSQVII